MQIRLYHTERRIDFLLTLDSIGGNGFFAANVPFGRPGDLYAGIPFRAEVRNLSTEPFGQGAGEKRLRQDVFYALTTGWVTATIARD